MLRIKLVKSPIGNNARNRATVQALGLRKMHQVVERPDTPSVRGMIHKVKHMLVVEEVSNGAASAKVADAASQAEEKPKAKKAAKKGPETANEQHADGEQ